MLFRKLVLWKELATLVSRTLFFIVSCTIYPGSKNRSLVLSNWLLMGLGSLSAAMLNCNITGFILYVCEYSINSVSITALPYFFRF